MVSWLLQGVLQPGMFLFCIQFGGGGVVIHDLLYQGFRVGRRVSKRFGCELLDEVQKGFRVECRASGRWGYVTGALSRLLKRKF
jgi:hypothetical protein